MKSITPKTKATERSGRIEKGAALRSEKIQPYHLERLAVVYIRQSRPQQVERHPHSRLVQLGLVEKAEALGWPRDRILLIEDDLGKQGTSSENRLGFQKLAAEVSLDHVGIVLGVAMSRIARSCKDWYQLLENCGIFRTLIADLDGIYCPDVLVNRCRVDCGTARPLQRVARPVRRRPGDDGPVRPARVVSALKSIAYIPAVACPGAERSPKASVGTSDTPSRPTLYLRRRWSDCSFRRRRSSSTLT